MRSRRAAVVARIVLALAAAAAIAAVLVLRDSDQVRAVRDRAFRGALGLSERVRAVPRRSFPKIGRGERRARARRPLDEPQARPTPHDVEADRLRSSAFPQTRLDAASDRLAVGLRTVVDRGDASFIAEPTLATDGTRVLAVWNWGAAVSADSGRTFRYIDPYTAFEPASGGFCCDQLAYYAPRQDLWIWVLQYRRDAAGQNTLRLAVARGAEDLLAGRFALLDLRAQALAAPNLPIAADAWLDNSRIAATDAHLFVSVNVLADDPTAYRGSLVIRIPLEQLAAGERASYAVFPTRYASAALTQGASTTMYFAAHRTDAQLRVWSWPDSAAEPSHVNVAHSAYPLSRGVTFRCRRAGSAEDGDWCQRFSRGEPTNDDRPRAGWLADGTLAFSWNAAQDPQAGFPYPFVMVVRIDEDTMRVVDEPFIWSPEHAFQYAAFAPNAEGEVAGVVLAGGGDRYESCTALLEAGRGWDAAVLDRSDSDPAEAQAGDYLGIVPAAPGSRGWAASCMTLHGGAARGNVEVRLFGFEEAAP